MLDIVPEQADDEATIEVDGRRVSLAGWVEGLLAERKAARAARNFSRADAIRRELDEHGVAIEDGPQGTRWKKVR